MNILAVSGWCGPLRSDLAASWAEAIGTDLGLIVGAVGVLPADQIRHRGLSAKGYFRRVNLRAFQLVPGQEHSHGALVVLRIDQRAEPHS